LQSTVCNQQFAIKKMQSTICDEWSHMPSKRRIAQIHFAINNLQWIISHAFEETNGADTFCDQQFAIVVVGHNGLTCPRRDEQLWCSSHTIQQWTCKNEHAKMNMQKWTCKNEHAKTNMQKANMNVTITAILLVLHWRMHPSLSTLANIDIYSSEQLLIDFCRLAMCNATASNWFLSLGLVCNAFGNLQALMTVWNPNMEDLKSHIFLAWCWK
jgi:hypothetical protein